MHGNTADPQPHNDSPAVIRERQRALLDAFNETHVYVGDGQHERPGGPDRCLTCELPLIHPIHKAPATMVGLGNYHLAQPTAEAQERYDHLMRRGLFLGEPATCPAPCGRTFSAWNSVKCKICRALCPHRALRGYIIKSDGRYAPRQYCGRCGLKHNPESPPRHSWTYNLLFKDCRDGSPREPCQRCGTNKGTQFHHWAPRAIFADADDWPTAALCPECHELWHLAMRTAGGYRMPEDQRFSAADRAKSNGGRA